MRAASLNRLDLWTVGGLPGVSITPPWILGADGMGVVAEVSADVVAVDDAGRITPFARDLPADVGAILGLHKTQDRPVALNGQVVIRPMMYVALSYDHRIIDGQQAVLFLVRVKELMEDPAAMLIDD